MILSRVADQEYADLASSVVLSSKFLNLLLVSPMYLLMGWVAWDLFKEWRTSRAARLYPLSRAADPLERGRDRQ